MLTTSKKKEKNIQTVIRRMRESSELTMRQLGAMIGISHVSISQFENGKLDLPDYRIEQIVKGCGYSLEEFYKILGKAPVTSPIDDCHAMIDRMDNEQLIAIRAILNQLARLSQRPSVAVPVSKMSQKSNSVEATAV